MFADIVRQALVTAGVRGVVQSGGTTLDIVDDTICSIGPVPHNWLFPQMSAVVHSGGAGTTAVGTAAAGLRAGIPTIAIPCGDQPFWARRLTHLGASAAAIPRPKLTAPRLAEAITTALADPTYRTRATELAAAITAEDAAARVITTITDTLDAART